MSIALKEHLDPPFHFLDVTLGMNLPMDVLSMKATGGYQGLGPQSPHLASAAASHFFAGGGGKKRGSEGTALERGQVEEGSWEPGGGGWPGHQSSHLESRIIHPWPGGASSYAREACGSFIRPRIHFCFEQGWSKPGDPHL